MIKNELLKTITDVAGITGMEKPVAEIIKAQMDPSFHMVEQDIIGNLYVTNPGKKSGKTIVLDAHMDDVGVQIMGATEDGKLKFYPVGGIDEFTLLGKSVRIGEKQLEGVFCANWEVKNNPITYADMFIEAGFTCREEAEQYISPGDDGSFDSQYVEFGDGFLKARNFDDRVGCAIMVELLKEKLDVEYTAVFTVREEVGLFGAKVSAFRKGADIAICLEGGGSGDIPFVAEEDKVSILGAGPALSVRNNYSIFDVEANRKVMEIAGREGIKCQLRRGNAGGCDGQSMQQIAGAWTVTLAPPNRYIHAHNTVISEEDYQNTKKLTRALILQLAREDIL